MLISARAGFAVLMLLLAPLPASAHAFGSRYDLPLPLWLYLTGAGAVVALSFAVAALFLRHARDHVAEFRISGIASWFRRTVETMSILVFALVLATAFLGINDPFKNFAPTFVWVLWWVGMAFISALAGNLWDGMNPWNILYRRVETFVGRPLSLNKSYPQALGRWPAVIFFFLFAWMELIGAGAEAPPTLAQVIAIYSVLTWTGMAVFGREVWLRHGEAFTTAYGLLARFAVISGRDQSVYLRPPAVGLVTAKPVSASLLAFTFLLLTTVTYDGLLETPAWASFLQMVAESTALRPILVSLQGGGIDLIQLIKTLALALFPAVFLGIYLVCCRFMATLGGGIDTWQAARWFVLSLIPIAIAYHLSHYVSYLAIAGQQIIPLASDPFGWGWDLFGTRTYRIDIGVITAKFVWYWAATAIVLGHIAAVYVAHATALRVFETPRRAMRSQIPMMVLMVAYTMVGLWILSQPVVE